MVEPMKDESEDERGWAQACHHNLAMREGYCEKTPDYASRNGYLFGSFCRVPKPEQQ